MTSNLNRRQILIWASALIGSPGVFAKTSVAGGPKIHDVKISGFRFEPEHLVVHVGDVIRWTNDDLAPHTATAIDGSWDSGEIRHGEFKSVVVSKGMDLAYFCAFHPHMKGRIRLDG